jgi:Extracellular mutant protein 11
MSSGVSRFVARDQRDPTSPSSPQGHSRIDTAAAQRLKFSMNKKGAPGPAPPGQYLASTAPPLGYTSNTAPLRNTFPNPGYQPPPYPRGFDEVTVGSDFDQTKSDLGLDSEGDEDSELIENHKMPVKHGYTPQAEQRFSIPPHQLHRVHSQQPLVMNVEEHEQSLPKAQTSGSHSRFQRSQHQHSDLQLRSGQPANTMNQQIVASKKRHRGDGPSSEIFAKQRDEGDDELEETEEYDLPAAGTKAKEDMFDASSDGGDTHVAGDDIQNESPTRQRKGRLAQSSQPTMGGDFPPPDYNQEKLKGMKYSDLKAEDWDTIPNPKPFELPAELQGYSLGEQITYYSRQPIEELALFYEHLSTSEWEQAGDWLVEKFGDLLKQLKDKRQEKRRLTEKYEAEIEAREKAVRGKSDLLDKKFDEMKTSGEGMLRGKIV